MREPLEAIVASWAIRTSVVLAVHHRYPDWRIVHYEDVAHDPIASFKELYSQFGLGWTDEIEDWLRDKTEVDSGGNFSTSRRSGTRIEAWHSQLSAEETLRIRRVLEPFDLPIFAGADDWPN